MIIIAAILSIGVIIYLGWKLASLQNSVIDNCFKVRKLHNDIITGKIDMRYISDSELLSLKRPIFTHIGMGGIGPQYIPSFEVLRLVGEELCRRRFNRVRA